MFSEFDWQTGMALLCVAAAAAWLLRGAWRGSGQPSACGGCQDCGPTVQLVALQLKDEA